MKNRPVGAELSHAERQAVGQTNLIVAFAILRTRQKIYPKKANHNLVYSVAIFAHFYRIN